MTGRRLYEKACDERAKVGQYGATLPSPMSAWPFLSYSDRQFWNGLARSLTPRKRVKQ